MTKKTALFLTIGLTGFIIYYIARNIEQFTVLGSINPLYLGAMLVVFYLSVLAASWRMLIVMKRFGLQSTGFLHWFRVFIIARFLSKMVPQGGNIYRGLVLKNEMGFSLKRYTLGLVVFTWIDMVLTFFFVTLVVAWFQPRLTIWSIPVVYISALTQIVLCGGAFLFIVISRRIKPGSGKFKEHVLKAGTSLRENLQPGFLGFHAVIGAGYFILLMGWFYFGFLSLGIHIEIGILTLFTAIMRIGLVASITPGNLGILEIAYGVLASSTGLDFSQGILIGAVTRGAGFTYTLIFGALHGGIPLIKSIKKKKSVVAQEA